MKKLTYLLLTGTVFFLLGTSAAFANDSPHNDDSAVACGDCHGEVLFSTDPADFSTPEELADAYNAMCLRCHDDTSGSYHGTGAPAIANHDSDAVGGRFTFKTGCLDCHHPHAQDQLWDGRKYYGSEYRLLTGLGSKTGTLSNPTRTIITYNPASLSPKSGSEWDEADPEDSLVSLANKTSSGRGAMFMPNTNSPYNARIIESVDTVANTITVKGNISSVSTAGFAITLGQVIKKNSPYATASGFNTVFLDHTGTKSFAHNDGLGAGGTDSTVTGLCQVCHTQTNHWRNTPDAARDNHYGGTNCMNCHSHASGGFKPTYEDHYDVASPYVTDYSNGGVAQSNETCISCHASSGTYKVDRDYVTDVHNSTCNNCHINFDSPPTMTGGSNGSAVGRDGDNSCSDCHGTSGGFNYNTDFEGAHDVKDHSGLVGKTGSSIVTNCNYCHTDDIVNLDATPDVHNDNCFNCHTNTGNDGQLHTGNTGPSYSGVVSVGDASSHTVGTTSNCGECHATRASDFSSHDHSNATYHEVGGSVRTDSTVAQGAGDTSQNSAQLCSACHNTNGGGLTGWDDIYVEHNSDCNICHNATRDTSVSGSNSIGATIQTVIGANGDPTNCSACHRDKITSIAAAGSVHGDHKEEGWVRGAGTSCVGCHDQDNNDDHTQYITVIHKNNCALCHTDPGTGNYTLKAGSSAENHRVPEDGAENLCTTCHSVYNMDFDGGHQNEDHQSQALNDVLVGSTNCATTCHTIDVVNLDATPDVHNDDCALCHTNTGSDGRLTSGAKGDATGHTIDSTSECVDCHAAFDTDFQGEHGGGFNHTGVVTHPNCTTTCHSNSVAQTIAVTHTDCTSCHTNTSTDGTLVSGANGDATGHVVGTTSSCADCHTSYASDFQTAHGGGFNHTGVVVSSNCTTTCHSNSVAQTIAVTHSDCTDCHTNTGPNGTLRDGANNYGDASNHLIGSTSSCEDCHDISLGGPGTDFDGGSHADYDHDGVVGTSSGTPVANCNGCHDGTTGPNIVANTHNINTCSNCHNNTGASGELISGANGYGDASAHTLGSTSSCADCHNARNTSFESHIHGDADDHKTGGSGTTIAQDGTDVSQESGTLCSACHQDLNGGATTLTTWDEIAYEHDLDGTKDGVGSCVTCHNATRDVCIDGGKCATGVNTVQDIIAANGDPTNCRACHAAKVDSTSSDATHGGHASNHFGWAGGCENCHGAGAAAEAVVSGIHSNTCDLCHTTGGPYNKTTEKVGANGDGDATKAHTSADDVPKFDPTAWTCTTCHNQTQVPGFHGITIAEATASHQLSSDSSGGYDCEACHDTNAANEQLSEHMPADTVANCAAICHGNTTASNASSIVAKTIINDVTFNDPAPNQNDTKCEDCHAAKDDFKLHGLTDDNGADGAADVHNQLSTSGIAGATDCANCHSMADVTARLQLHTQPNNTAHSGNCLTCHVGQGNPANAQITAGIGGAAVNCNECHTAKGQYLRHGLTDDNGADGVVDVHDQLAPQSGSATSICTNCHLNSPLNSDLKILQVHTQNWLSSYDCTTCHSAGAPVSTVIADGWKDVAPSLAQCDECHATYGANWYNHTLNHDDSGTRPQSYVLENSSSATNTVNCVGCHSASASPFTGGGQVHDAGGGCDNCHTAAGVLVNPAAIPSVTAMPAGGGECTACHGNHFNGHTHVHDVSYNATADLSQDGTVPDDRCANCHDDAGNSLAAWNDIYVEHLSNCGLCHNYTSGSTPPAATVASLISNNTTSTCVTCHTPKDYNTNPGTSEHGYLDHDDDPTRTVVTWTGASGSGSDPDCIVCHDDGGTEVVYSSTTHGGTCSKCHAGVPNPLESTTTLATSMPDGGAGTDNGGGDCVDCHTLSYSVHEVNNANSAEALHNRVDTAYAASNDCDDCHGSLDTWVEIVALHDDDCTMCHDSDLTVVKNAITTGRTNSGDYMGSDSAVNCDTCHVTDSDFSGGHANWDLDTLDTVAIKDTYGRGHGNSASTVRGEHNRLLESKGAVWQTTAGGTDAAKTDQPGTYNASIILSDSDYNCNDCHTIGAPAAATTPANQENRILEHVDCVQCHTYSAVSGEISAGAGSAAFDEGAGGTDTFCEICHASGNEPATPADYTDDMYQYDGERHHTTPHAQAGDCTWCHGDPRTSPVTGSGWAGASVANEGFEDEYTMTPPASPAKQLPCRECHTNRANQYQDTGYSSAPTINTGGNDLIVYTNTYTAANLTSAPGTGLDVTDNGVQTVGQSERHRIPSASGTLNVYNYGACLACHTVQIFHAKPIQGTDWTHGNTNPVEDEPYDVLRFAPGRGKFNLFELPYDCNYGGTTGVAGRGFQHGLQQDSCGSGDIEGQVHDNSDPTKQRAKDVYKEVEGGDGSNNYETVAPGDASADNIPQKLNNAGTGYVPTSTDGARPYPFGQFQSVPQHASVNDAEGILSANTNIPYFDDIAAPAIPDDVEFVLASWDGATVTVQARNDDGCAALSARTQPDSVVRITAGNFTGTTLCTGTFALGSITGVTLDIETTNAAGTDDTGNSITDDSTATANAVNDSYTVPNSGTTTLTVVTDNDTGSNLSITNLTQPTGGCGSTAINGLNVDYTASGTCGPETFTYEITSADFPGSPSIATVTITAVANQPPAFGSTTYTAANATENVAYSSTVHMPAVDPESDPITYSRNGGTCSSWATVNGAGTISGTPLLADVGTCTVIVRASATGGTDDTTVTITVDAAPAAIALLAAGAGSTDNYSGTADTGSFTYNIAGSASDNRLLVVSIAVRDSGFFSRVSNISGSYGNQALTEITEYTGSNRASVWLGYCDETCISNATDSLVRFDNGNTGWDTTKVQVMTFANVNQTTPTIGTPYQGGSTGAGSLTTSSLTMGASNMPIYSAVSRNTGAHSVSTTATGTMTEMFENLNNSASQSTGHKTDVSSATSGTITVTFGGSERCALTAAVLRHVSN